MRCKILGAVIACAILVPAVPLWAHHSFSAGFDQEKKFTMTGTLTKVAWLNPHIELWLEARGEGNELETWRFEGMPPSFFRQRGIDKTRITGEVGRLLTVKAARARDGSHFGLLWEITFADGKSVELIPEDLAP